MASGPETWFAAQKTIISELFGTAWRAWSNKGHTWPYSSGLAYKGLRWVDKCIVSLPVLPLHWEWCIYHSWFMLIRIPTCTPVLPKPPFQIDRTDSQRKLFIVASLELPRLATDAALDLYSPNSYLCNNDRWVIYLDMILKPIWALSNTLNIMGDLVRIFHLILSSNAMLYYTKQRWEDITMGMDDPNHSNLDNRTAGMNPPKHL